ncbi:MAG: prepilin-type N-terminal cleavage/methylation domain-containing protein [bacterium]
MEYWSDGKRDSPRSDAPTLRRSTGARGPVRRSPGEGGFTLIEILLVVVITAITSVMAIAAFSGSFQSAQLRSACKAVVMSHKYARSMAVLDQKQMAMLVDTKAREIEIVTLAGLTGASDRDRFLDSRSSRAATQLIEGREEPARTAGGPIASDLVREFPRDIQIESFKSRDEDQSYEGVYWVTYYPNGMSDGFTITLVDKHGKRATVTVDPISGMPEVENER